jgi:hypothetical protein
VRLFTRTKAIGSLAGLALGLFTWLVTGEAVLSLVLGILVELFAMVLELQASMSEELDRLGVAAELRSLLFSDPEESLILARFIKDYSRVKSDSHPFFAQHARERVLEIAEEMRKLRAGRMDVGADLVQIKGVEILKDLRTVGFATALGHLYEAWLAEDRAHAGVPATKPDREARDRLDPTDRIDPADRAAKIDEAKRQYHRQSINAARKRKVPITRVFLLETRDVRLPAAFTRLIDDQSGAGINVLVAYCDSLPDDLVKDFGLWDDTLVAHFNWDHKVVSDPDGKPIVTSTITGVTYFTTDTELLRARRTRDRIRRQAVPWEAVRDNHLE